MNKSTIDAIKTVQAERLDTSIKKSNDYSSKVDIIGLTGIEGISYRIFDKAARLLSLASNPSKAQVEESLEDTLKDLANYADYGVVLLRNKWEKPDVNKS